jgi:hypothetical protein
MSRHHYAHSDIITCIKEIIEKQNLTTLQAPLEWIKLLWFKHQKCRASGGRHFPNLLEVYRLFSLASLDESV